jgi:hypothetical protein
MTSRFSWLAIYGGFLTDKFLAVYVIITMNNRSY